MRVTGVRPRSAGTRGRRAASQASNLRELKQARPASADFRRRREADAEQVSHTTTTVVVIAILSAILIAILIANAEQADLEITALRENRSAAARVC